MDFVNKPKINTNDVMAPSEEALRNTSYSNLGDFWNPIVLSDESDEEPVVSDEEDDGKDDGPQGEEHAAGDEDHRRQAIVVSVNPGPAEAFRNAGLKRLREDSEAEWPQKEDREVATIMGDGVQDAFLASSDEVTLGAGNLMLLGKDPNFTATLKRPRRG